MNVLMTLKRLAAASKMVFWATEVCKISKTFLQMTTKQI